ILVAQKHKRPGERGVVEMSWECTYQNRQNGHSPACAARATPATAKSDKPISTFFILPTPSVRGLASILLIEPRGKKTAPRKECEPDSWILRRRRQHSRRLRSSGE